MPKIRSPKLLEDHLKRKSNWRSWKDCPSYVCEWAHSGFHIVILLIVLWRQTEQDLCFGWCFYNVMTEIIRNDFVIINGNGWENFRLYRSVFTSECHYRICISLIACTSISVMHLDLLNVFLFFSTWCRCILRCCSSVWCTCSYMYNGVFLFEYCRLCLILCLYV